MKQNQKELGRMWGGWKDNEGKGEPSVTYTAYIATVVLVLKV